MPACANGADDDGDGLVDYPLDPDCASASDDDETAQAVGGAGGMAGAGGATGGAGGMNGQGGPPDLGGVTPPGPGGGVGQAGGCGCRTAGDRPGDRPLGAASALTLAALSALFLRRRRRAARVA